MSGVCVCGRKLGKACLKELVWGRRGGGTGGGGGGLDLDWAGLDWIGLTWIGLMRGCAEMQDARCGQCGKRSGWDERELE